MIMSLAIFALSALCLSQANKKFGIFSFVFAGTCSFIIYSLPAILGISANFYYDGRVRYFVDAQPEAIGVTLLAWVGFSIVLLSYRSQSVGSRYQAILGDHIYSSRMKIATILSFLGIVYLVASGGFLFFSDAREEQVNDLAILLWRWVILIGFAAAIIENNRRYQLMLLFAISIIFIRGDRTIPAIAGALYLVLHFRFYGDIGGLIKKILKPKFVVLVLTMSFVILLGKPIYLSIKENDFSILSSFIADNQIYNIALTAEPFVTFNHIYSVINLDISIDFADFFNSIWPNITIMPSLFGFSTNLYNEVITAAIPYNLNYGIAGNYWAHGWVVGGYFGVLIFSLLYATALIFCDIYLVGRDGRVRLSVAVLGALTAVYVHRNGLDNFLSFVRQICVAAVVVHSCHLLTRARVISYSYGRP